MSDKLSYEEWLLTQKFEVSENVFPDLEKYHGITKEEFMADIEQIKRNEYKFYQSGGYDPKP
jgi:hypothetical protein